MYMLRRLMRELIVSVCLLDNVNVCAHSHKRRCQADNVHKCTRGEVLS
jgi:hypothetical protein